MANALGNYNAPFYAANALIWLRKFLGMAGRVYLGFDEERKTANHGETINIKRPGKFTAQNAPSSAQDIATDTVAIALDQWKEVKFKLTDKERAYTGERIIQDHILPAVYAIVDNMDAALHGLVPLVPHAVNSAGATMAIADILAVRRKMFDLQTPMQDESKLHFMVGGQEEADLLALSAFTQWQGSAAQGVEAQMTGSIGRRFGFGFFATQNRGTITYPDLTDKAGAINNAAGYPKGTTSIAVDALGAAEVYPAGTIIKITLGADLGSEYALTAPATGAGATITISPGLRNAVADNDTFDVQASQDNAIKNQNVAFHRDAFAIATAALPEDDLGDVDVSVAKDEDSPLSVRARIYSMPDISEKRVAIDVLYGVKLLNADLATRFEITSV